jgi:uncharacterized protein YqiB (DUF1249 family)
MLQLIEACIKNNNYIKILNGSLMPLVVERIREEEDYDVFVLAHYGELNGDLMSDPDMEVKWHKKLNMVEALSFTNHYVGVYHEVYPEPDKVNLRYKAELNDFLRTWLINLKQQGFYDEI